jgi:AraC family transcriptional regulator of adaptative response/methylated-DNA-[protein]-cysteine methyltransferase
MTALPPVQEMVHAYQNRDASYDGIFYLGVKTTRIFCRPSCPARNPYPENVDFFATSEQACHAGYRPCKRCHPLESKGYFPAWAEQLVADIQANPHQRLTDDDLRAHGLEPATVRRTFLRQYGVTFQAYTRAQRMGKALEALNDGANLDDVIFNHGYESHSGFREAFMRIFGQAPGQSRGDDCVVTALHDSPVGSLIIGATQAGVCLLEFPNEDRLNDQVKSLQKAMGMAVVPGENVHIEHAREELDRYFRGELKNFTVPIVVRGTTFQEQVWGRLLKIPYGETRSYADIAQEIGQPTAMRAVGMTNGMNRVAIVIPCHRVVNKGGALGGYGGGLWRKKYLLNLEQGQKQIV